MIRPATVADAEAVGSISTRSWRLGYRGLLPDEYLDGLSGDRRIAEWSGYLEAQPPEHRLWVAEEAGRVAGFCRTGPADDEPGCGEVYGLYVDPDSFGRGHGSALFARGVDDLHVRGYPAVVVWVFEGNERALRLYERAGFALDGGRKTTGVAPEIRLRRSFG